MHWSERIKTVGWHRAIEEMDKERQDRLDAISDPWELLDELDPSHGLPLAWRFGHYSQLLGLIDEVVVAAERTALTAEAARVLRCGVRDVRKDLRRGDEMDTLRRMMREPSE